MKLYYRGNSYEYEPTKAGNRKIEQPFQPVCQSGSAYNLIYRGVTYRVDPDAKSAEVLLPPATYDTLSLNQSFITSRIFANGIGDGGNIDIQAGSVSLNQSVISASTEGQGNAGKVSVQAADSISLIDSDISTATPSRLNSLSHTPAIARVHCHKETSKPS